MEQEYTTPSPLSYNIYPQEGFPYYANPYICSVMTVKRRQSTGAAGMLPTAAQSVSRRIGVGSTRRTARGPSGGKRRRRMRRSLSEGGTGSEGGGSGGTLNQVFKLSQSVAEYEIVTVQ